MLDRLRRALGLRGNRAHVAHDGRWVVVDVETSGLDKASDVVLAIGAVAVCGERIAVDDSFEVLVRPERTSARENILVHGIGEQAQRAGLPPQRACAMFVDYVGTAPLVAFHAAFDRGFLSRAVKTYAEVPLDNAWLDLAELAPVLHPQVKARALDEWLVHFGIAVDQRHHASSDAFATAMLFLRLLAAVAPQDRQPDSLIKLAAQAKWLPR